LHCTLTVIAVPCVEAKAAEARKKVRQDMLAKFKKDNE
jgi:hypothetical protein